MEVPKTNETENEETQKFKCRTGHLKTRIRTVHEGHKDYKCESCAKSFSQLVHLKKHIYTIHQENHLR